MKKFSAIFIILALLFTSFSLTACKEPETSEPMKSDVSNTTQVHATTKAPVTSSTSEIKLAPDPMPADFDLPVSQVPEFYPDILGVREKKYDDMPTFTSEIEISQYVLHNFLNKNFEMEFYISKELTPYEDTASSVVREAGENALTYYAFSSFRTWDSYAQDNGDEDKFYAKLKYIYEGDEKKDLEACAEALEFVMKNPVPYDGFKDFDSERDYALKIHDFIARKITYSPIGYDMSLVLGSDSYVSLQEAYNALAEEETEGVCAAYARAFAMICHYAGINAVVVTGLVSDDEDLLHAWNVLFPCDGSSPVLVDVTWDDGESEDIIGQEFVNDAWFYLPLNEVQQHDPYEHMNNFILEVNGG